MKLRPPAIPLITVDPYFSVWSPADRLYDEDTVHWTNSRNTIEGFVTVDGEDFRFIGHKEREENAIFTPAAFAYGKSSLYIAIFFSN